MSTIRMIAIDLDDTLLHDDISVSSYTKDTLRRVMEKGIPVVIATGRMFQAARPWGKEIGLGDVPMICYTGALVGMCRSGRILEHVTMNLELARDILETGRTHGWYMHTYIDDEVYMPFRDERTDIYEKQCGITAHIAGEKFWKPEKAPTKILVFDYDTAVMKEAEEILKKKYGEVTNQVKSKPEFFEMNTRGISKGTALKELCRKWNIPTETLMTIGNGHNDISMFDLTPWSFAVANAHDSAKEAARFMTDSNNDDGVARAIEKYVLEG